MIRRLFAVSILTVTMCNAVVVVFAESGYPVFKEDWFACKTDKQCGFAAGHCQYVSVNKKHIKDYEAWSSHRYSNIGPTINCIENMNKMKLTLKPACVESKCELVTK